MLKNLDKRLREETGLPVLFHHHSAGYVETPVEIDCLLDATDPSLVNLVFDTGHYVFGCGPDASGSDGKTCRSHSGVGSRTRQVSACRTPGVAFCCKMPGTSRLPSSGTGRSPACRPRRRARYRPSASAPSRCGIPTAIIKPSPEQRPSCGNGLPAPGGITPAPPTPRPRSPTRPG